MDWNELLSNKLLGDSTSSEIKLNDGRSQFQRDFDRVVFSSAFRRLQDKTQVFPLPENDFVHTRLTHSLEVSCVGRSLGSLVGEKILSPDKTLAQKYSSVHFGEIVAAACLAHDIGNPPFGHSGEDSIAEYFKNGNGQEFEKEINDNKKWTDFIKFEGNAQGFRIITKLQNPNSGGGLKLTCAALAAFTKYPKESLLSQKKEEFNRDVKNKFYRKFGFFQTEKELFAEVAEETSLIRKGEPDDYCWSRHPLSFLVEAADDICYRIMDLEDGFRLGLLSFKYTEELLLPLVTSHMNSYEGRSPNDKIGYLRAKAINDTVAQLADAFINNEQKILNGEFEQDLISVIDSAKYLEEIKDISKKELYAYRSVVEREAAGYEVLGGLLDAFINAVNETYAGKPSWKSKNLMKLLPGQFLGAGRKPDDDLYIRLLKITDFVSGMTDSYAVSLFRKIKGISLPGM
jgi:dGTPase